MAAERRKLWKEYLIRNWLDKIYFSSVHMMDLQIVLSIQISCNLPLSFLEEMANTMSMVRKTLVWFFSGYSRRTFQPWQLLIIRDGLATVSGWRVKLFQVFVHRAEWISQSLTTGLQNHVGQQHWTSPWVPALGWLPSCEKFVCLYRGWQNQSSNAPVLQWMGLHRLVPSHYLRALLRFTPQYTQWFVREAPWCTSWKFPYICGESGWKPSRNVCTRDWSTSTSKKFALSLDQFWDAQNNIWPVHGTR